MARTGTIIAIIVIVILIIIGGSLGYTFLVQNQVTSTHATTSSSRTTTNSSSTSTVHTTSTNLTTSSSNLTTVSVTSNTTNTTSSTTSKNLTYALQLLSPGPGAALYSPLTTTAAQTFLPNDNATVPYVDHTTHHLAMTGDFEPSRAWFFANSSGLTLTQETKNAPHIEWDGQHEENVSELSGVLYQVPLNSTVFSIQVFLPNYTQTFANCIYDNNDNGCSYQGQGPAVSANWALNVYGPTFDNSVAVSVAEGKGGLITVAAGTASVINGTYVGGKYLGGFSETNFTSSHTLTISTDRKSFVKLFVDNRLVYANTTLPISLSNGTGIALNFYQFTSVNNETISTTWSNVTTYASNQIIVGNLTSGMSVIASGPGGFNTTVPANASGFAVIDASTSPTGVTIKVVLNGSTIATYPQPVSVGSRLELNATSV